MSEPATKAVFLSYASQDAEAAKRIADALRAAGVEVWFDAEGGLEHGDEWDAKIRRQIKECVLFIAVISANTQAREEGYFRIEWELAAQRALGIASGVAFILPVVIDGTKEPGALVPDRFRSVQWTRLPGGNVPPDVLQRFLKLWSHRAGVLKHANVGASLDDARGRAPGAPLQGRNYPALRYGLAVFALFIFAVAAYVIFRPRRSPEESARIVADAQKPATAATAATPLAPPPAAPGPIAPAAQANSDWPRDPELKRAMRLIDSPEAIASDVALAEDIIKGKLADHPTDVDATVAMGRVQVYFLVRGFDRSDDRFAEAKRYAERALALTPDDPEAMVVMATYLYRRGVELPRAGKLLRQAIGMRPAIPLYYRMLDNVLSVTPGVTDDEIIASAKVTAERFPQDALVQYELARHYRDAGMLAEAEHYLDLAIKLGPVANAIIGRARLMLFAHGDPAGMKAILDQLPERYQGTDRAVFSRFSYAMVTGQPQLGLDGLQAMPEAWMIDFDYTGPTALLQGELLLLQGKAELARLRFTDALAELGRHKMTLERNFSTTWLETWLLMRLGRLDEARKRNDVFFPELGRPYRIGLGTNWWFNPIAQNLLLGEQAKTVELVREAAGFQQSRTVLRNAFRLDPRMAPFRDDPEIKALLAGPEDNPAAAPAKVDDKSIAVLAFANLSDDKANEYFSDGISEELLNVLAKIPGLKVSARTSAFYFKGKEVPVPEIAKQLGVAYVVEGSVRKSGDKVRITAQLIKAADGFQMWSDTFTRDLKDIFAVQDEIAGLIAGNLQAKMAVPSSPAAVRPEAYTFVLQARHAGQSLSSEGWKQAIGLYRQAVELDPGYAVAWAELARCYVMLGRFHGLRIEESMSAARAAAQKALQLDPDQPAGLAVMGWIQRTADWDWPGAQRSFRRALELAPDDLTVMTDAAICFFNVGRIDDAMALAQRARERDPLNPQSQWARGWLAALQGRYEEGIPLIRRAIELAPTADEYHSHLARALVMLGRLDEAEAAARLEPKAEFRLSMLVLISHRRGDTAAEAGYSQDLIKQYGDEMAGYIAGIYALEGRRDEAFAWLERAYQNRDGVLAWSKTNIFLAGLHDDPRWPTFLRKMGLADDQLK